MMGEIVEGGGQGGHDDIFDCAGKNKRMENRGLHVSSRRDGDD